MTEGTVHLVTKSWIIRDFSIWFLLALIVPILWSTAHITIRYKLQNSPISPNQITFFRVLISSIVLLVISISVVGLDFFINGFTNIDFQFSAFLMGLFYYLELVSWFYAIKHVGVSVASSITTPTPIVTMILAILILGEYIQSYEIIAMIIVIIGLYGILYFGREIKE